MRGAAELLVALLEQLEAVRSSSNCQAIRLGIVYKGHSAAEWPTSVLLKMNSFGPQEHPQLEHEQAYLQAELAFLCDAMAATHPKALDALRGDWRVEDVVSPKVAKALGWQPGASMAHVLKRPPTAIARGFWGLLREPEDDVYALDLLRPEFCAAVVAAIPAAVVVVALVAEIGRAHV